MSTVHRCITALAAVAVTAATPPAIGQDGGAGSQPSTESVRASVMNNWTDSLAVHYARQLYPKDAHLFGPYLAALHSAVDWPVNQIDGATAFFHGQALNPDGSIASGNHATGPEKPASLCESSGAVQGDSAPDPGLRQSYPSVMCFDDGGVLNVEYLRETQRGLPIQIEKAYAMVPAAGLLVVRYTLANNIPAQDGTTVRARLSEVVHLHNKGIPDHEKAVEAMADTGLYSAPPGQALSNVTAQWHPELNAWIADMSASNGTFLAFGALQTMQRHRAFHPVGTATSFDAAVAPEMDTVEQATPPQNVDQLVAADVGLALWGQVDLRPGVKQTYYFFYAVAASLAQAQQLATAARSYDPGHWFDETRRAYQSWLQQGRPLQTPDPGLGKALSAALVTAKQAQQPEFGSFVAATNPAYGHKVWPRDSSVTALGLAAAGHLDEAVKYFRWMAAVQEDGSRPGYPAGTWYSNYSYWLRKGPKSFREPEWDSLGLFMTGVYQTWRLLQQQDPQAAQAFLTAPLGTIDDGPSSVYEAVQRTADFLQSNVNAQGFGPGDFSIWEEDFEWATFTQANYASGLNAAHLLAQQMGDGARAAPWLDAARVLLNTIHRAASAQPCPGLWNDTEAHWNRATWTDCKRDDRLDAASDLVWVFGLVDSKDPRVVSQRNAVLSHLALESDHIGIARYEGDEFYHASPVSPGGQFEASTSMPSWPQLDMYMSMLEHWRGMDDIALRRLQWYARVTNAGYMPPGEAVDRPTNRPLVSTASEPVTAAWYVLALMTYFNQFDPRLPPLPSTD